MKKSPSNKALVGTGFLTAIAASLCCITPVLALVSGSTSMASNFSWLEPMRPYLIGTTIVVLGLAWYQKLKKKKEADCDCETDTKPAFWHSKNFLLLVTLITALLISFPYYAEVFYSRSKTTVEARASGERMVFSIEGMTCGGCEAQVEQAVNALNGILSVKASHEKANAVVVFNPTKASIEDVQKAINGTGYKVINHKPEAIHSSK
jgi:mercuric ion transport protein